MIGLKIGCRTDIRVGLNGEVFNWTCVTERVHQGSVLAPISLTVHINNIDVGLNDTIWKFPDDKGIGNIILSRENKISSKEYLSKIVDWLYRWQIPFTVA